MKQRKAWVALVLVAPAFGFTNCEHFNTVTVPASDSTAPIVGTRYLDNDGGDAIRFDGFVETIHGDVGKNYFVAPYGFDGGGVQALHIQRHATKYCENGDIGTIVHYHFLPESDEGSGGVGDQVSNGRYLYFLFRPLDYVTADSNCEVDMTWAITAVDYNGNTSTGWGGISYLP